MYVCNMNSKRMRHPYRLPQSAVRSSCIRSTSSGTSESVETHCKWLRRLYQRIGIAHHCKVHFSSAALVGSMSSLSAFWLLVSHNFNATRTNFHIYLNICINIHIYMYDWSEIFSLPPAAACWFAIFCSSFN